MLQYLTFKYNKALLSLTKESETHIATKKQLQEAVEQRIQFKYERDKLQTALNTIKQTIKTNVPHINDLQQQNETLTCENEKLKFELNCAKQELRETIRQHTKRKMLLETTEKEKDLL